MSTTLQGIDARGYLVGWAKALAGMMSADINAVPDDKWTATFGGCTRPANELAADGISLMLWTSEALKGNVIPGDEGALMKKLATECATKGVAIAKLNEAVEELAGAISNASDETMNTVVPTPWGMDTPLFMVCQIAVSHIWYHDGQLNYIHCLLGDNQIHWMG